MRVRVIDLRKFILPPYKLIFIANPGALATVLRIVYYRLRLRSPHQCKQIQNLSPVIGCRGIVHRRVYRWYTSYHRRVHRGLGTRTIIHRIIGLLRAT